MSGKKENELKIKLLRNAKIKYFICEENISMKSIYLLEKQRQHGCIYIHTLYLNAF